MDKRHGRVRSLRVLMLAMLAAIAVMAVPTSANARAGGGGTVSCMAITPGCMGWPAYCRAVAYDAPGCATYRTTQTASLEHKGWTYLNLNYCAPGFVCAAIYRSHMAAWRWTGTRWALASLPQGHVYVHPYTDQWRWAWTRSTGWVAVIGGRFEIR